jgi:hypothetical protein
MDGKLMVKTISLLIFMGIYFSAYGQKASYYIDSGTDLNKFPSFYMPSSSLDAHDLTDPFLNKKSLSDNNYKDFVIYNELSLKNLTIIDGHGGEGVFEVYMYEGSAFEKRTTPLGYKSKKLKGQFLVIDILNSGNQVLVWRGWIDLKKVKADSTNQKYQKAICCLLANLKIEPEMTE